MNLPISLIPSLITVFTLLPNLATAAAIAGPINGIEANAFIIVERGPPNKESNKLPPAALAF